MNGPERANIAEIDWCLETYWNFGTESEICLC